MISPRPEPADHLFISLRFLRWDVLIPRANDLFHESAFQITTKAYVRALFKTVTLDRGLVSSYRADLDQDQQRQQEGGGEVPQATLRALTSGEREPAETTAQSPSSPGILGLGGMEAAAAGVAGVGEGDGGAAAAAAAAHESGGENGGEQNLLAREAALRDEFLFEVR